MSAAVKLEVVAETAQRDGGYAVIRLKGVSEVPSGTTYRIEPVDDDAASTPEGWPTGPLSPVEVRPAGGGSDLVIGPDIVDHPKLRPGTPVAIVIEALDLRQELLWPSLTPSISPRRPARVLTMTQSAAMTQALRDAERRQAMVAQITKSQPVASDTPPAEAPAVTSPAAAAIVAATLSPVPTEQRTQPATAALSTLATARDRSPPSEPPGPQPARLLKIDPPEPPPVKPPDSAVVPVETSEVVVTAASDGNLRDRDGYLTDYVARRRSNVALMFGTLALVLASAAAGFAYRSSLTGPASPLTTASVSGQAERIAVPASTLFDIFKNEASPEAAAKLKAIDRDQALSLADTLIHSAGSQRDLRQAEALLKHGLGLSLGDKSTLWALTQLGSLAAQPTAGEPDYGRARLLWELAAAHGDPIAMCFLGELHEQGLGVPTSRPAARSWYLQAKQAGGCRTVDAALARLK